MKRKTAKPAGSLPYRQVHLDFHTSPLIEDVGIEFDAKRFAATMKRASVNSVTVFAKCHHGHLYYDTKHPARHPGLDERLDLLREQVDALHDVGIRAPIYLSVLCDEFAANTHPEWVVVNPDGTLEKRMSSPFKAGWQILDMSSPYQEYLAQQTAEVLRLFKPVDGIFFDMCWDQVSISKWSIDGMRKADLDPETEEDRKRYAHQVSLAYLERFHKMVQDATPGAGVFFNARPFNSLAEDVRFQEQIEIEALPTGGWGYVYFPKNVRFARTFGKPYLGMTARFHKAWADFGGLKPHAALEYETSQMIAHGARCSIGDQLHPRGRLEDAAYEMIGRVYQRVADREVWIIGATPMAQIGVFQSSRVGDIGKVAGIDEGATRMLTQLRHQFDVVDVDSQLDRYELIILPDAITVTPALAKKLRTFVKRGGALLATGSSGLSTDAKKLSLPDLGVKPAGLSPFSATYVRFGQRVNRDVPAMDHVMYEPGVRVTPVKGATSLAGVVEPYFERAWDHFCSHAQTPAAKLSKYSAATIKGRVAYIAYPIFGAFARHGSLPYRLLVRNVIDLLLREPMLRVSGPSNLETSVMRQDDRTIVHLLYYPAERRTQKLDIIEDIVPLANVEVSLRTTRRPKKVYLAPERTALKFDVVKGRVTTRVPELRGHAMVVFE